MFLMYIIDDFFYAGPFGGCHNASDTASYYESCVYDMCAIPGDESLCDVLESYARDCVENGGELLSWRTSTLCRKY